MTSFSNFFYFVNPFAGCKVPYKRTVIKIGIYKRIWISFSFCPRSASILLIAFGCLFAFLQIVDTCFSKFDLLSISIPRSVTDSLDFIWALFMVKQQLWFDLCCRFIIIAWNFLGFTIMLLSLSHLIATSLSFYNNLNNSLKSLFAA